MRRLIHLIMLLCLPFLSAGQDCVVKVKSSDEKTYNEALEHYGKKYYREASQLMRRVAQHNPKAADPQFWLGMMSVRNGFNTTGIRKYFTRCMELCPDYPNALAHYYMGVIYYTDEHYQEARTELETYFRMANGSDDPEQTAVYDEASAYLHWAQFLADAELHRAPFNPRPLSGVSSRRNENLPFITPDGKRCYFLREVALKKDRTAIYASATEKTQWKLFCSEWRDTAFTSGVELPAPFNQGAPEGGVSVTADGHTLYFSRITNNGGYANSDLYCAELGAEGAKWKVSPLGNGINGDRSWESQPSVSADGQWLYFASNRKGGQGGIDIWRCHRLKNGDWSRPENLGPRVNTVGNDKFPFIHADGHTLYFVSDGWQGFGGYDVYFIDLASDTPPTNLGLPFNTEGDELSFGVTADGTRAYFPGKVASSRSTDVLIFDLYEAARPEAMRLCHMTVGSSLGTRDTLLMLSEQRTNVVTLAEEGFLPAIQHGRAGELDRKSVTLHDSVSVMDLNEPMVADALAAWLIEHPRVHIAIECPRNDDAKAAYEYLTKQRKLRAERLTWRGGTAFATKQIRLQ